MKTSTALGIATVGGAIAYHLLPEKLRGRMSSAVKHRVGERVEKVMMKMPDDAPPKLIMKVMPKLESQNEEIIAMLRQQNELLQRQQLTAH